MSENYNLRIAKEDVGIVTFRVTPRVGEHIEHDGVIIKIAQILHRGRKPVRINANCEHHGNKHNEWWVEIAAPVKSETNLTNNFTFTDNGGKRCVECGSFIPNTWLQYSGNSDSLGDIKIEPSQ